MTNHQQNFAIKNLLHEVLHVDWVQLVGSSAVMSGTDYVAEA
jgi:hypothetical protein